MFIFSLNPNERMWNKYNFIVTFNKNSMFEGQRLQYVVPGYTGHIPHKVYEDNVPLQDNKAIGKIPGINIV